MLLRVVSFLENNLLVGSRETSGGYHTVLGSGFLTGPVRCMGRWTDWPTRKDPISEVEIPPTIFVTPAYMGDGSQNTKGGFRAASIIVQMGIKELFLRSPLANYGKAIRSAPREVIFNHDVILSAMLFATSAIPATWDQGSASVIPSLPGFQQQFHMSSGANAKQIKNFVSLVYIGYAVGAALSFFINDRIGRLWSYRLYITIWTTGQLVACFSPGVPGLYASRIISGMGIGALTVIGPMAIVEIAPMEIRGLLSAWFTVAMALSLFTSVFCVYGVYSHIAVSRLQYQTVFFAPCILMLLLIIASFFLCESPRWLFLVGRREEGIRTLAKLRGLPSDHPRVSMEIRGIEDSISKSRGGSGEDGPPRFIDIVKETFTGWSNLRRLQQVLVSYALAQLSGANSITSYFVPILSIMGLGGDTKRSLFLSGMYAMSKLFFCLIASFFFIDALGRRKSLFVGITLQMISDIYIGVYIKYKQQNAVSLASSEAAIAAIFTHAFGYSVGLLILPYVFGAELWPDRIRSFGGALGATFHWLFIYGFQYGLPSLLAKTDNWGAFLFFACWCFMSLLYVYLMVPEIAGLSVEEIDALFKGPWFNAFRRPKQPDVIDSDDGGEANLDKPMLLASRVIMQQNSRKKRTSEGAPRSRTPGSRIQVACINCKERKLKCDAQVPACANCDRHGLTCLVEDPATKRHQPRNYTDTLEDRVALLEGLLQQMQQDATSASMEALVTSKDNSQPTDFKPQEDDNGVSDLASKVGMLGLHYAAGAEPQYLGSSSTFAFSRIINSTLRQGAPGNPPTTFGLSEGPTDLLSPCPLPSYEAGVALSDAYFQNIHLQYPFLHEPTFRDWEMKLVGASEGVDTFGFDSIPLFFVNMVYAIGALLLPNSGSLPQQLYASAQIYIGHVLLLDNLESIQAILCCIMYSLRSPAGPSIWKLSGLALRQCIELGYHRNSKRFSSTADPLRLELRKRVFWCAYGIDCAAATTLGRPLGVPLQEVDSEIPMDINDIDITSSGICVAVRSSSSDPPTTMSTAIHVIRLRCLWARIHTSLYSDTTPTSSTHASHTRTEQLRAELEDWIVSAPPTPPHASDALSIFACRDWFDNNYNYSILLLYRGQLTDSKGAADDVFMECLQASENICRGYRRQYIGRSVNYTWGTLHCLFMAGLTYLHCLWASAAVREMVRHDSLSSTCSDCTIVLVVMAERWKDAAPYRDIFEALASSTRTMMVNKNHEQWIEPASLTLLDSLDQEDLSQWMADINDISMSDGIDTLLTGLVGDFIQQAPPC
ncbi:hypothetical protein V497_01539 [Pseudogymnoascus sp. VKM F-4516 (FW-969)]|nr:hypothetical protein V490_01709 [Pseudogymnoascus sp. VKM F-3557]KFY64989.1 hypothetical protein V497_01539 [Pseudogymnoascus sp. VKM F-4516 (FW-969)]